MKKTLINIFLLLSVIIVANSCKPDKIKENDKIPLQDYQYWYIFKPGSYWVYQNSNTGEIDSVYLNNSEYGYYTTKIDVGPSPIYNDEYYNLSFFKSSFFNRNFNQWSINTHLLLNGDINEASYHKGQIIRRGDPSSNSSINTKYKGCLYVNRFASIILYSNTFNDIEQMRILSSEQTQPEFEYDTELFFAKNIGIIKKDIHDTIIGDYSWELIRWKIYQ